MNSHVQIRQALATDATDVAVLLAELGYPTDAAKAIELLATTSADPGQAVLLLDVDGDIYGLVALVSFFYFHQGIRIARLSSLVVSDVARGQGLGRRLLRAAEAWAQACGCQQIELTSSTKRERAHKFYEREGYQQTSLRFVRSLAVDS